MAGSAAALRSPILPDVLASGLSIVFCGTAVSAESRRRGAYYGNPGNRFWRTLHEAGFTPRQLDPSEFGSLPEYGIGLTDLAKHHSGQDAELPADAFDAEALAAKIKRFAPKWLAFTSKNAAKGFLGSAVEFGPQAQPIGLTRIWVLPSTSGLAVRWFDLSVWTDLANEVRAEEESR